MNQKQEELVQKLYKCFKEHGRALSRREYLRLENRPCSISSIERNIGWGLAKDRAEAKLKEEGRDRKISEEIEPEKTNGKTDRAILESFGLKQQTITQKQWKTVTEWIVELQKNVEKLPKKEIRFKKGGENLILLISDTHFGKAVYNGEGIQTYNKDISISRINLLKHKFSRLIEERLRVGELNEIYICLIGDIIDGSGIYPNQEASQDITSFPKQICLATAALWDLISSLYIRYGIPIRVKAVRGNHGRQYKYALSGNNFDYMVYQLIYLMSEKFADITVQYSIGAEYLNFSIKDLNVHMRHIAPPQAETAAGKAKFGGWRQLHNWDILLYGHLHHPGSMTFHESNIFMNGTIIGGDDLSERMATSSRPCQTAVIVNETEGVLGSRYLYVDEADVIGHEAEDLLRSYPGLDEPLH